MLQQTQAARVAPAYRRFMQRFPTVEALAASSPGAVLREWAGLGYNRRAIALFDAARRVAIRHEGRVPSEHAELENLPGVGPYTAAAVASIGYGIPVAAVEKNVRRVLARAALGLEADAVSYAQVRAVADRWLDPGDPGAWNQALMDLGRHVCRPTPRCEECPIAGGCRFRSRKEAGQAGGGTTARVAPRRPTEPFAGSFRELRGAIVAALRDRSPLTVRTLVRLTGRPIPTVTRAIRILNHEGLVLAERPALAGRPRGRVQLSP
jgi:A/G-specific adenine glycosylase